MRAMDRSEPRIGMYVQPRGPQHGLPLLQRYEDSRLDTAWVGDTLGDWRSPEAPLLDAWPVLGAYAHATSRIELGVLVSNVSWRRPVEVARFTMSVDQLSFGRFVLGLGCGQLDDQVMAGDEVLTMLPGERVDRLQESITVVDRLLRGDLAAFSGRFASYERAAMAPGCVQRPRVPIVVAGNGRRVVGLAGRSADTWNTYLDTDDLAEFVERTRRRIEVLETAAEQHGRNPASIRRSVLALDDVFDAWSQPGAITRFVATFAELGFTEFGFYPPTDHTSSRLRDFLTHELPDLR